MSHYHPREEVLQQLHGKTLVMVVGPAAIGKSSLMNEAIRLDHTFARVSGLTTRVARPNDEPGLYRYVSEDDARQLIGQRELVQYVVHPTTGKLYGTEARDYPADFNLQDTLSASVDFYRTLPFGRHVLVSLTTDPTAWQTWLQRRYPQVSPERDKRLQEARMSIEWSLSQAGEQHWLVNRPGDLSRAATELIAIARGHQRPQQPPAEVHAMLATVKDLLSYK